MGQAIEGVAAIAILMVVGFVLARARALPAGTEGALTAVVYWAATPALLFHQLATAHVARALYGPLIVAASSGIACALVCAATMALARCRAEAVVLGTMAGSVTNAVHIGLPIAVYVIGRPQAIVPVVVFQLAFLTPLFFTLADWVGQARRFSPLAFARTLATNPMVIAMVVGASVGFSGAECPRVVSTTAQMLGQAAPALVLLAFGASLSSGIGPIGTFQVRALLISVSAKLVIHPLAAWAVGLALGLDAPTLFQVTVMAALPSAHNAYVAAQRSGAGLDVARGAVAITSIASLGVIVAVSALLHPAA